MKIFTQIGHDKKATQWPALLILEILFNVINFDIAKVKDNIIKFKFYV